MTKILTKIIFILLIIAVFLPMLFLLIVAVGEIAVSAGDLEPKSNPMLACFTYFIAVLWFFDLVLLVITLALKELFAQGILEQSDNPDEIIDEEFNELINRS